MIEIALASLFAAFSWWWARRSYATGYRAGVEKVRNQLIEYGILIADEGQGDEEDEADD